MFIFWMNIHSFELLASVCMHCTILLHTTSIFLVDHDLNYIRVPATLKEQLI